MRRRAVAGLLAAAALGVARPGSPQPAGVCVLTPDSGEGPFYFDPKLLRRDITEGQPGAPLALRMQVVREGDCAVLAGGRVDLWHADALGLYSGYERQRGVGAVSASTVVGATFLRGTQITSEEGTVDFATIYPSWYQGRTPHVHFKVFLGGDEVVASQIFFPDEVNDEVFAEWPPYREHAARRDTRNADDTFLTGRTAGAFCEVGREGRGYRASVLVAVRAT